MRGLFLCLFVKMQIWRACSCKKKIFLPPVHLSATICVCPQKIAPKSDNNSKICSEIDHQYNHLLFLSMAVCCLVLKLVTEYQVQIREIHNSHWVMNKNRKVSTIQHDKRKNWWCTVNYLDNCNVIWTQETNKFHFKWIHTIQWATLLVHLTTHMCTIMSCRHYA